MEEYKYPLWLYISYQSERKEWDLCNSLWWWSFQWNYKFKQSCLSYEIFVPMISIDAVLFDRLDIHSVLISLNTSL